MGIWIGSLVLIVVRDPWSVVREGGRLEVILALIFIWVIQDGMAFESGVSGISGFISGLSGRGGANLWAPPF